MDARAYIPEELWQAIMGKTFLNIRSDELERDLAES